MPKARPLIVIVIATAIVVGACSPNTPSPSPSSTAGASSPLASNGALSPSPSSSVAPSGAAPSTPPATSQILVAGSALEVSSDPVGVTPTRDGGLFVDVSSNASRSTVLTHFDSEGRSTQGWPVTLSGTTSCDDPMPVEDGSVRMLCTLRNTTDRQERGRAFAFDAAGRGLPGWPVEIGDTVVTGRLVGDSLRVLVSAATDPDDVGRASEWFLVSIDAGGAVTKGVVMPASAFCCGQMTVGPDGAAYVVRASDYGGKSRITAFDMNGGTLARFPGDVVGVASGASFDSNGNVWLVSALAHRTSRLVFVFETGSAPLPFAAADPPTGDTGGCQSTIPEPPVIPRTGPIILYSDVDDTVLAVERSFETIEGWPFVLPDPLVHPHPGPESEHEAGYCPGPLSPVIGPDGTVYLSLEAHKSSVGGSLVAIGLDGRVRAGWPVGLKRSGAEFWTVKVGPAGTVYAVAYEPAAPGKSTATLLAIAPDSTILYRTTIVAPG